MHYEREGAALIWVVYGLDLEGEDLALSFKEVISRPTAERLHAGEDAVRASKEMKTLVLKCHLQGQNGTYGEARLVRLDELNFTKHRTRFWKTDTRQRC